MLPLLEPPTQKPPAIVPRAVRILYLCQVISMVFYFLNIKSIPGDYVLAPIFCFIFTCLAMLWLISKIGEGYNWAWITVSVLFSAGVLLNIPAMLRPSSISINIDGMILARWILEIIALIMLFTPGARPWFRSTEADLPPC